MKRLGLVFITVMGFALLVKLGLWQLSRGEEKLALMQQLEVQGQQQLSWTELLLQVDADLAGTRLVIEVTPQPQQSLLLDNRTFEGKVGYQWLLPVEVASGQPWLLLDLGFVAAGNDRRVLPDLPEVAGKLAIEGRLYRLGVNPLSSSLLAENLAGATRIQAVNFTELEAQLGQPILPWLVMVEEPAQLGFPRRWQPISLSPEKHQGYALQWFGLAIAWLVIAAILIRRSVREPQTETGR